VLSAPPHAGVGHAPEFGPALRIELAEPAGFAGALDRVGDAPAARLAIPGLPPAGHAAALAGREKGAVVGLRRNGRERARDGRRPDERKQNELMEEVHRQTVPSRQADPTRRARLRAPAPR